MTDRPTKTSSDLQRLGKHFTRFLLGIAIILAILELFLHRHGVAPIEDGFMFPAIFGFFGIYVHSSGWQMASANDYAPRRLLRRGRIR